MVTGPGDASLLVRDQGERALTNRAFVHFLRDSGGIFADSHLIGRRPDTGEVA
jgi:hypothetical protein